MRNISVTHASMEDLDVLCAIEAVCFPASEAADRETLRARIQAYGNHFYLGSVDGRIVGFIDGMVCDSSDLSDDLFADAGLHNEHGAWQMVFGVNTLPAYRGRGYASELLRSMIADAKKQGRKGLVLTCKEALIPFYQRLGFENEGMSQSSHGGATWYQMRYWLKDRESL